MGEDNVSVALRLLTEEVSGLQTKLETEGRLSGPEIDRLNGIQAELKKLRGEWVISEIDKGTPQNRVAEMVGVTPARISQILRELGR